MAELTGLEVLVLTEEIDSALRGSYVNNVYSIGDGQIIRFKKPDDGDAWLVASPKLGVWISEKVSLREETTPFTTTLRRLLERARAVGTSQVDLDRIFVIDLKGIESRRLIVELMPPGNMIVTDMDGKILAIKEEVRSPRRRLSKGVHYEPPAQSRGSPSDISPDAVMSMARAEKTSGRALGRHLSLPRKYIREVLARLSISEESPSASLLGREEEVVGVVKGLVSEARSSPSPCLGITEDGDDVFVVAPKAFEVRRKAETVSQLCDELFLDRLKEGTKQIGYSQERRRLELEARVSRLKEEEATLLDRAGRIRSLAASGLDPAKALDLMRDLQLTTKKRPASAAAVSSILFDEAKVLESKAGELEKAAKRLKTKGPAAGGKPREGPRLLPRVRREWYEKFRWFRTSSGKMAIGGRDAGSNSVLIRRHLTDEDTVYHADLFGSPFFVLKGGKTQTESDIGEVAQATVSFSSAWKTGLGSADAYWVAPAQIKTAAPSGEYLARGSFAITGRKNFVPRNLVEIAVGMTDGGKVTAGPEAAFRGSSPGYLVLRPHREKPSETAKRVLRDLVSLAGELPDLSVDEVVRVLPAGGGKVVRKVGGAVST